MSQLPDPQMPAGAYTTFGIRVPRATHFRPATCEETDCPEWRYGWKIRWDVLTEQQRYDLEHSPWHFTTDAEWAVFEAGQPCFRFRSHSVRIDKPEIFLKKNLHMSSAAGATAYRHKNAQDWTDDFMNTTQAAVDEIGRG